MDENHGIGHAVVLCLSQLYCNGGKERCFDAIKFQNDFNSSIQEQYSQTFTCSCCTTIIYL